MFLSEQVARRQQYMDALSVIRAAEVLAALGTFKRPTGSKGKKPTG